MLFSTSETKNQNGGILISPFSSSSGPSQPELVEGLLWVITATLITVTTAVPLRGRIPQCTATQRSSLDARVILLNSPELERKKIINIVFLYKLLCMW